MGVRIGQVSRSLAWVVPDVISYGKGILGFFLLFKSYNMFYSGFRRPLNLKFGIEVLVMLQKPTRIVFRSILHLRNLKPQKKLDRTIHKLSGSRRTINFKFVSLGLIRA